jgi:hypothetical protein
MQQTALPFGARSHWLQPWRAYLDTVPAERLRAAIGINLNVSPDEAPAVCRHLARNGFRNVRFEVGWGSISWDHPDQLADQSRFEQVVRACKQWGLRPLFLLNSNQGQPCPTRTFRVRLVQPATRGDRTIKLDPSNIPAIVPGRSGLSNMTRYWAAEVLFTAVAADGTVTLSKPLPKSIPAGEAAAATLKYLPFYPSRRQADHAVPTEYQETLAGWLKYVEAITTAAKRVLGTSQSRDVGFDLEVWNELTFGSSFLSINNYYEKPIVEGDWAIDDILSRTVSSVIDPANGLPGARVGDGFANQRPWGAGSIAPPGLGALDKHPYAGAISFPRGPSAPGIRPVDALGNPDGIATAPDRWKDSFIPTYVSYFPEYSLSAIQTEHLIRDLSPITTDLKGTKHGRNTHPLWPDGRPAPSPQLWVTEINLDPQGANPADGSPRRTDGISPVAPSLTPADADHLKAKAVLRYLVSYVNKGAERIYFFAAKDDNPRGLGLVSNSFFGALKAGHGTYPVDDTAITSPTLLAVRRLVTSMTGGAGLKAPRMLSLLRIAEDHGHRQFEGDPAAIGQNPDPHPPLYNRDVLAFFPFQTADHQFVVALYVMTRDMAHLYHPGAPSTDVTRFDMPDERYRLSIGGVHGRLARVRLYDPLWGTWVPFRTTSAGSNSLAIDVPLTDCPRLLQIVEEVKHGHGVAGAGQEGEHRRPTITFAAARKETMR